jgi:hypothetical protein
VRAAIALVGLVVLGYCTTARAFDLAIQVQPNTLVVSSGGDHWQIHTNYTGALDKDQVAVFIWPEGGEENEVRVWYIFQDDCDRWVVRCKRVDAAGAVGPFDGKRTTATVTLEIIGLSDASQDIDVRK